jgi:hypothetical protein
MGPKTNLMILISSSIILYPLIRKDKNITDRPSQLLLFGFFLIFLGVIFTLIDKGLDVVIINLMLYKVVFPGHLISFGYWTILITIYMWIEKLLRG